MGLSQTKPFLARFPWLGLAAAILGFVMFGALALDVQYHGLINQEDQPLAQALHQDAVRQPHPLVIFIRDTSFYLGREVITFSSILLAAYFLGTRRWRELALVFVGVGGAGLLWFTLSTLFNRPRPSFPDPIESLTDPSFPSGHSISSVVFYGLLVYLIAPHIAHPALRWLLAAAAVIIIALVGIGRLYAGGHYLTDVLAGYAFGIGWAGLSFTAVERIFKKKDAY